MKKTLGTLLMLFALAAFAQVPNEFTGPINGTYEDSGTNTVVGVLNLYHTSTGTPATGIGSKIVMGAEDSAHNADGAIELQGYLSTVTDGSERGAFLLRLKNSGTLQDALSVTVGSGSATVTSNQATVTLWDTATAVTAFPAATTVNVGGSTTASRTVNVGNTADNSAHTTLNLITSHTGYISQVLFSDGSTGKWRLRHTYGTDSVSIYSDTNASDLVTFGTGGLTTALTSFDLFNTGVTTANAFGAGTAINIGGTTGTVKFANPNVEVGDSTTTNSHRALNIRTNSNGYLSQVCFQDTTTNKWRIRHATGTDNLRIYSDTAAADLMTWAPTLISTSVDTTLGDASTDQVTLRGKPILTDTNSPTSSGTGTAGMFTWDSSYLYICTATNTWKRVALTGGY